MLALKYIILFITFISATLLGLAFANKYKGRVIDLKNIKSALNILETKIKYTYEPLPQIFEDISNKFTGGISEIFKTAKAKMDDLSAGEAWNIGIESSSTNMSKEDLNLLKGLDKLLGKTNVEGQLSEIELIQKFIDTQITKAEEEQRKNEKLYKNLGIIVGLAIVIILI